jgi:hypothetical protein
MPLDLSGVNGELCAAGRWAATLSGIVCHISPSEAMAASGNIKQRDAYWLAHGAHYVLRLQVGKRQWQWRNVAVSVDGNRISVTGQGRPEIR